MRELSRSYPQGSALFAENDPGSRMYVVKSGKVKIWRRLGDTEIVLATITAGDFFGEMAILEGLPRSASATIVEEAELIEIDKQTFEQMLLSNAEIAMRMLRKLSQRLREADQRLQNALVENGLGRVIEVLRWLLSTGQPTKSGDWVRLPSDAPVGHIFTQAGIPLAQKAAIEARLERAQVLRSFEGDVFVADVSVLDEFGEYLHLHQIYDPLISHELAEVHEMPKDSLERLVKRMLVEKMSTEHGIVADPASDRVIAQYDRYLRLKERFG